MSAPAHGPHYSTLGRSPPRRGEASASVLRKLAAASSVSELVEMLHDGRITRDELRHAMAVAVLGEPEEPSSPSCCRHCSWSKVVNVGGAPILIGTDLAEEVQDAGLRPPTRLAYAALLATGDSPAACLLMSGVLGDWELHVQKQAMFPPVLARSLHVLATDALVVTLDVSGHPVIKPTAAHGNGQMPHSLCLGEVTASQWSDRSKPEDGDVELRLTRGRSYITLQASWCKLADNRLQLAIHDVCLARESSIEVRVRVQLELLRATFDHLLLMMGYYISQTDAMAAFQTVNARGLHSQKWFRKNGLNRLKMGFLDGMGCTVVYSDAIQYWLDGVDLADFDKEIEEHLKKGAAIREQRGCFWESDAELHRFCRAQYGWACNKDEVVQRTARARALFMELNGPYSILFCDGDGSDWHNLSYDYLTDHTQGNRYRRSEFLFQSFDAVDISATYTEQRPRLLTSHRPLELHCPFARRSVSTIVIAVCRTAATDRGNCGEFRGLYVLHAIYVGPQQPKKLAVKFHKVRAQGFGKASGPPSKLMNSQQAVSFALRLSPLIGGPDWKLCPPLSARLNTCMDPFRPTDLIPLASLLDEAERPAHVGGMCVATLLALKPELNPEWLRKRSREEA